MGWIKTSVDPVLLFAGILYREETLYQELKDRLSVVWGPILWESDPFDFVHTDYYEDEMGVDLRRSFLAFRDLIHPGDLACRKVVASQIESEFAWSNKRRVNVDPGYVGLAKVVLASTKDYSHRIHLEQGIYAEVTLRFIRGVYVAMDWTYPDYREERTIAFFNHARKIYCEQLRRRATTV